MTRVKVGVQIHPQHSTMEALRDAWRRADAARLDSIWTWDHFFPIWGESDGPHFEGWTQLAAMAVETTRATIGVLVSSIAYRNPDLLVDMARTVDHLSGGRVVLGLGAGWFERDYEEYGFEFGSGRKRLGDLEEGIARIKRRLPLLNPPPLGRLPLMIGGTGEKVALRIVAENADIWNTYGPVETFAHKNEVLDRWCDKVGRDPESIERTVLIDPHEIADLDDFVRAGADHLIVKIEAPYDLTPAIELSRRASGSA